MEDLPQTPGHRAVADDLVVAERDQGVAEAVGHALERLLAVAVLDEVVRVRALWLARVELALDAVQARDEERRHREEGVARDVHAAVIEAPAGGEANGARADLAA